MGQKEPDETQGHMRCPAAEEEEEEESLAAVLSEFGTRLPRRSSAGAPARRQGGGTRACSVTGHKMPLWGSTAACGEASEEETEPGSRQRREDDVRQWEAQGPDQTESPARPGAGAGPMPRRARERNTERKEAARGLKVGHPPGPGRAARQRWCPRPAASRARPLPLPLPPSPSPGGPGEAAFALRRSSPRRARRSCQARSGSGGAGRRGACR